MLNANRRISFLPRDDWQRIKIISWLAARHDMTTNVAYFARTNLGILFASTAQERQRLEAGNIADDTLYAVTDKRLADGLCQRPSMTCIEVDGMVLASHR